MQKCCSIEGCERPHSARGWCATHYARWARLGTTDLRPVYAVCRVANCKIPPRSKYAELCEMHYGRMRRNGSLEIRTWPVGYKRKVAGAKGYIRLHNIEHPLANGDRTVFEHRAVAYDARGGAPPVCEWCGLVMDWSTAVIDHADDDASNNAPENLLVSCHQCNSARGQCGARRFAEGVAIRMLCRKYADERAAIVENVLETWQRVGGRITDDDYEYTRVHASIHASHAIVKGPRGNL